jgi:thioredoxin reductase (NADPH)
VHVFHEIHDVIAENDRIVALDLKEIKTKAITRVACDVVLPMLGYVSDMGALTSWGLTIEKDEIVVNQLMETGRAGIWAAGDVNTYPGKLKLIATGFGEAAIAVNQAVHWIHPDKKVNPGHSSHLAVFGQKAD